MAWPQIGYRDHVDRRKFAVSQSFSKGVAVEERDTRSSVYPLDIRLPFLTITLTSQADSDSICKSSRKWWFVMCERLTFLRPYFQRVHVTINVHCHVGYPAEKGERRGCPLIGH